MAIFQDVFIEKPGRSLFNLSHERKFSADWANLYPILCTELVPGDTFKVSTEVFVRTAPLVAPIMHRVNVKVNYFFVPYRIIWDEWKDFITGINQNETFDPSDPDQSNYFVTKVPPYYELTSSADSTIQEFFTDGSLADFLGFPTMRHGQRVDGTVNVQVLPFRAYTQIFNDWYRNQNVEHVHGINRGSGLQMDNTTIFQLRKRMYEKDYFTSALPFAQRGDAVQIPSTQEFDIAFKKGSPSYVVDPLTGNSIGTSGDLQNTNQGVIRSTQSTSNQNVAVDNSENLKVTGGVTLGTINDLRIATKLQQWLEINARVGGRYIEQILGHFGIHSSDARLQRAEYLGGWSSPILVDDVPQTSATEGSSVSGSTTPQGNLAGKGTSYFNGKPIKCFAEEHGFLIGILSILPRTSYQDGLPKMFQRWYKEDYYFPKFAHLGEQEVNKAEVYFDLHDASEQSFDRFGFQERFCEYKYIPSTVHGEFKDTLQFWHLGRSFDSQPALTSDFVTAKPRTNIFAVERGVDHFYVNLINNVTAMRPMPKQAIPTL